MVARIAVTCERRKDETRVAATPETVRKLTGSGFTLVVEAGAGRGASIADADYAAAGAEIAPSLDAALKSADILFKVRGPDAEEVRGLKNGAILVGLLDPFQDPDLIDALAMEQVTAFAMELVPRITRAQAMDALSSQANLAG